MLLQFRQIKSGVEIRAGSPDASHAGWMDQKAADITGDLLFGAGLFGIGRDRPPLRLFCYIILCRECGASSGLTTLNGGSTTPAMQAGLTGRRLTLREIFCSGIVLASICEIVVVFQNSADGGSTLKRDDIDAGNFEGHGGIMFAGFKHGGISGPTINQESHPGGARESCRRFDSVWASIVRAGLDQS